VFNIQVDTVGFEKVCILIFQRVKKLSQVPFVDFCTTLRDLADEHSGDTDTPYSFCLPEQAGFGALVYPHEQFLEKNNLLTMDYWKSLVQRFRDRKIVDQEVIGFSNELCDRLGISY